MRAEPEGPSVLPALVMSGEQLRRRVVSLCPAQRALRRGARMHAKRAHLAQLPEVEAL
ncbi:MAG: hypothetical protein ACPIOQ_16130 [Promethearchaeia archaeon]